MNFVDRTTIRLADPATRNALFDQPSLEQLLRAAYDVDRMNLEGPYSAVFEELRIGVPVSRAAIAQGWWAGAGGLEPKEVRLEIAGIGADGEIRVDALWRGAIVARTSAPSGRIAAVEVGWPTAAGIDEEIVAALGALPASPIALEQERRTRYLARLKAAMAQPDVMTDVALDRWLREAGARTVGDLIERLGGTVEFGAARVTYSETAAGPTSPKAMPIAIALIVRDAGFSVAELLAQSKQVRDLLEPSAGRAENPSALLRQSLVIAWMIPAAVFDDNDWPTRTNPAAAADRVRERREVAGSWLAREGVGLVVI